MVPIATKLVANYNHSFLYLQYVLCSFDRTLIVTSNPEILEHVLRANCPLKILGHNVK